MTTHLNFKLLIPTVMTAVVTLLIVAFLGHDFSQMDTMILLSLMIVAQGFIGYVYGQKRLTQRFERLQTYIDQVVSVDEAPTKLR